MTDTQTVARRLEERLEGLPLLPSVVLDLLRLDPKGDHYFEKVSSLISGDPPFAARVLRAAASAAMAPSHAAGIPTIHQAITRLGARGAVNLVVTQSATRVFLPRSAWERELWVHALSTATLANRLAPLLRLRTIDPAVAYLAGLMHDIGHFVLYLEAPDELREIGEVGWTTPTALIQAEKEVCGFTHAELGYLAACKWQLPEDLAGFIRHHHAAHPGPPHVRAEVVPLIQLVRVADWLAMLFPKHVAQGATDPELFALVGLHMGDLFMVNAEYVTKEIRAGLEEAKAALGELGL